MKTSTDRLRIFLTFVLLISIGYPASSHGFQIQSKTWAEAQQVSMSQIRKMFYKTKFNKKIDLVFDRVSLEEALHSIAQKSGLKLTYRGDIMTDKTVSLQKQSIAISDALDYVLKNTPLDYKFSKDGYLIIHKKTPKQENAAHTVEGTVTDAKSGNTLPGVNVVVVGTSVGASTDAQGHYTLNAPTANDTLRFSFIGYEPKIIPINGQKTINVSLQQQTLSGDEVVVVGYGTQKKSDVTGSVSKVKSEDLMERPAINVEQTLAGKMAGVNVSTNSGRPGGRTRVRIRGYGSINADNAPLYVVDGVVMTNAISTLNPNNIESVEVLKDASATAIYGTRGSNGVILITTKRGSQGSQITYDGYMSISHMARKQDVLSSDQFLSIEEQAYENAQKFDPTGFTNGEYTDPIEKRQDYMVGNDLGNPELFDADLNPLYNMDWQDAVTRTAISQAHNLSYTGGKDKTTYGLFMGYNDEKGIIKTTYLQRASVRGVLDTQVKDWIKVGGTISYSSSHERRADERVGANTVPRMMIEMIPIVPYQYSDGTYGRREDYPGMETGDNPLAQLHEDDREYKTDAFNGNTYVTLSPTDNLDFTSRLGVNVRDQHNPYFNSKLSNLEGLDRNYAEMWAYSNKFWQWSNHLNYATDIGKDHSIDATLGTELQHNNYVQWYAATRDMSDDYYKWYNLEAGATPEAPRSYNSEWSMASYFGRLGYAYKSKYLLTVTGRVDGSSRFGEDNKYAFFPSAALGWKISEEQFLEDNQTITNLKLRFSYGLTGNSEIGEYQSLANLTNNTAVFNGTRASGTVISTLANPNLQWEKTEQYDAGFDLGLWEDRVQLEADVYLKKTKDLLLDAPVPNSSGYSSMYRNIGSLENKGFELSLSSVNVQTPDFTWSTNFNYSYLKNEITSLGVNDEDIFPGPWFLSQTNILRVGESVGSFWGLIREGTWDTNEASEAATYGKKPGDLKFRDLNDDGQINSDDYAITGKGIPDFYGTFSNTFQYKNFDLLVELQYSYGNDVLNLTKHSSQDRTGIANSYARVLNAWTPDNQDTPIAQYRPTSAGYDTYLDTNKLEDGSFIRGKNIMLGYNLPASLTEKLNVKKFRVYVSAQNFFLITKYTGYDPETTTYGDAFSQGIQFHDYPKSRTFMMGVNLTF